MMPTTDLALFKAHLNLDHDLDDALLALKLAAAEEWCSAYIGAILPAPIPAAITEAILQLAAHWYESREAVAFGSSPMAVPFGVLELLRPHREEVTGHVAA